MEHRTWEIPVERQRPRLAQTLDDLRFTLVLLGHWLVRPFVVPPRSLTEGTPPGATPVIIVPGFICAPWVYRRLQAAIHAAGHPCHVLDLGFQVGSILTKARQLSDYITLIGAKQVRVIGHSMGGLILAACLQQGESRIARGWTLGAPLYGTNVIYVLYAVVLLIIGANLSDGWGAYLLVAAVFLSPALRQMLPGSDLVGSLARDYPRMEQVTSVFCELDLIAFRDPRQEPGSSSRFGREDDVLFPEAGHNNIVMGDNAIRAMVAALDNA